MHAICPSIWVKRLNKIGNFILKKISISFKDDCHSEKWKWGCTSLKDVLHFSTYCIVFLQEFYFLSKGRPRLQGNYFEEVESFLKKCYTRKMRGRLSSIKGCISSFHIYNHLYLFFARIVLLIQGAILSSRQVFTCTQYFPLTTIFLFKECCNDHQPLHIFTAILNVDHTLHIV